MNNNTTYIPLLHSNASDAIRSVFIGIITNHNEGIVSVTFETFIGYFKAMCAYFPYKDAEITTSINEVNFKIKGKDFITIRREGASVSELQPPATTPLSTFTTEMDEENEMLDKIIR